MRGKVCAFEADPKISKNSLNGLSKGKNIKNPLIYTHFFRLIGVYLQISSFSSPLPLALAAAAVWLYVPNHTHKKRSQIADSYICVAIFSLGFFSWLKKFEFQINAKNLLRGWKSSSSSAYSTLTIPKRSRVCVQMKCPSLTLVQNITFECWYQHLFLLYLCVWKMCIFATS